MLVVRFIINLSAECFLHYKTSFIITSRLQKLKTFLPKIRRIFHMIDDSHVIYTLIL